MMDRRAFFLRLAGMIGLGMIAARCVGPDVTPLAAEDPHEITSIKVWSQIPIEITLLDSEGHEFPELLERAKRRSRNRP